MPVDQLLKMSVKGLKSDEMALFQEGITYPSLLLLNSHLNKEREGFRKQLLNSLHKIADEKGMMYFFVNKELQKRYPADLESTALYAAANHFSAKPNPVDLDEIKKHISSDNLFQTWVNKNDLPIDYISQLIMCLCYKEVGLNVDAILENILKYKFNNISTLKERDFYYVRPLIFIYFTIFIKDKGVFPKNYRSLVSQFIEGYKPNEEIEKLMIKKICLNLRLSNPDHLATNNKKPIFTNGHRRHIEYFSSTVDAILKNSAIREGLDFLR